MMTKEANDLTTLNVTTLFSKLQEHEQELTNLNKHEKKGNKENQGTWKRSLSR